MEQDDATKIFKFTKTFDRAALFFPESAGSDFIYGNPIRRMEDGARGWTGGRAPVGGRGWVVGGGWVVSMGGKVKAKSSFFHFLQPFGNQTDRQRRRETIDFPAQDGARGPAGGGWWVVRLFTSRREPSKR